MMKRPAPLTYSFQKCREIEGDRQNPVLPLFFGETYIKKQKNKVTVAVAVASFRLLLYWQSIL